MRKTWLTVLLAGVATAAPKEITFHADIVPVLQKRCVGCHRPGEAAPMSFLSYASTRPWAKAISEAARTKKMPPWFADAPHGAFANDPSLSASEIDTLVGWAESGAREGDPKTAPPPLQFADGWNIGTPELVIDMPEPYVVPAKGVIEYQHIVVPTGFREDKWIQAVEIRPGSRSVVHHVVAFVRPPGSRWLLNVQPGVPVTSAVPLRNLAMEDVPEFLLSYAPGRPPTGLPQGQARLIKAGSDIVLQLHYTPNGTQTPDRSKIGFIFAQRPPKERVATLPIANSAFVIPPGAPDHRVDAAASVAQPARLLRLIPHMHLRGKSFEVRLVSGGDTKQLLRVPRYDFRWQNAYSLNEPILLKPGHKIECTAWYDNSSNNPFNPDAKAEVRWGDQSWEEMMLNYIDVAVPADFDPKRVLMRPPSAIPAATARSQFFGTWKLVGMERRYSDGRPPVYPFGRTPVGRISYDGAGRMSAQLADPNRPKPSVPFVDAQWAGKAGVEDLRKVLTGIASYYGTFDVDESTKTVIHHVEMSLNPEWPGTDLKRSYQFAGNQLTLSAAYPEGSLVLVWEREKD